MNKHLNYLAIICGGPSPERGISLNSARSVVDHLAPIIKKIDIFYVSPDLQFYHLSPTHLYSNTPLDFDFKLESLSTPFSEQEFINQLQNVDLVFPIIHGAYGEDGTLQSLLEKNNIPYVGPSSSVCNNMYHKPNARIVLEKHNFSTCPVLELDQTDTNQPEKITTFFQEHDLTRAVVKPAAGGSSIGVFSVETAEQAFKATQTIFTEKLCNQVLIEPYIQGKEFTLILLQNPEGDPVALVPSQIQINCSENQLFDYRRKYLPTANTQWLCPPQFEDTTIDKIRSLGEQLFKAFGIRDFTRMDGWLLESGEILFTDFNPISGMEQNSFIFQQGAWMGLTHQELLTYIIRKACQRYGLTFTPVANPDSEKEAVAVLMGGATAERQVSLMSGSNAWLKLRQSNQYQPSPFFLDTNHFIWSLPYAYALSHTVEEIEQKCLKAEQQTKKIEPFQQKIRSSLGLNFKPLVQPKKYSLAEFLQHVSDNFSFLFLGLHGGIGEDGTIQKHLDQYQISYNGSRPEAAAICMDKNLTAERINSAQIPNVSALEKVIFKADETDLESCWQKAQTLTDHPTDFVIKPQAEGCSAGIIIINNLEDLKRYCQLVNKGHTFVEANTFPYQSAEISLMADPNQPLMLEPFIEIDPIFMKKNKLVHTSKTGWLELTIGVLEKEDLYHALNPSITVAAEKVLSLEEKFQGGTGINLTPPPESLIPSEQLTSIKVKLAQTAQVLGIQNYCRIDFFYNTKTQKIIIIEANSLPALTPSTVIYHQALAEPKPVPPLVFIESLIKSAKHSFD
ncbi:MAG: hypothetical protein CMM87_02295 [Rickettsiales bacterium]|nr:hypothetical protein [Rickettsiales bacterium]|tara:strand:- start:19405 stop:21777 length:2373 start_codon:yes stop_codon:yes gene_type:complete